MLTTRRNTKRESSIEHRAMFTISVETHFKASHQIRLRNGSKESSHFHDWVVAVDVGSDMLNKMDVVMNFQKLKQMLDSIVAEFDNASLNDVRYFQQNNPSAENVAKYIFEKLESKLPVSVRLESVKVIEEPGCSAKFSK
jgi:6-pyruvoyltetrahydropterin/6-carboxytetrahydropterin synthase